jgi:hypothetical protein
MFFHDHPGQTNKEVASFHCSCRATTASTAAILAPTGRQTHMEPDVGGPNQSRVRNVRVAVLAASD